MALQMFYVYSDFGRTLGQEIIYEGPSVRAGIPALYQLENLFLTLRPQFPHFKVRGLDYMILNLSFFFF